MENKLEDYKKFEKSFNKTIYFSPRKRENQKLFFLEKKKILQALWPLKDDPLYYSEEERKNIIDWANITSKFLACIKEGEEFTKRRQILKKKFYLYSHTKKPSVLIECHFFKVFENEFKTVSLLIPKGIPEIGEVHTGRFIRKEVPKKDWMFLDEGIFNQKFLDFYDLLFIYRGKKLKFTLNAKPNPKDFDSFLLSLYPFQKC